MKKFSTLPIIAALSVVGCDQRAALAHEIMVEESLPEELEKYKTREGKYPSEHEGLKHLLEENGYSEETLFDPWGNAYVYKNPSTRGGNSYDLVCLGQDGIPSDDDFIYTK